MIDVISIHIPKTAGTSFYQVLMQVYGNRLSSSLKRRDIKSLMNAHSDLASAFSIDTRIIHAHVYYKEVEKLHLKYKSKVICWLRNPTARVISNYNFFMHGLHNPMKNKDTYELNKHRTNETLLTYAQREENRNRMSKFLNGIELEELFFFGILESFAQDVNQLADMLNWPNFTIPHLNNLSPEEGNNPAIDNITIETINALNALDIELYQKALVLKQSLRPI